ncbi:hypothetical protein TNCV_2855051 [Trichonephila clavipes]|nr:hypothetical protein TNCV_2855051 [Trichonephila clavipes]
MDLLKLSTYHPLLRLTERISTGFQNGYTTGAVFLDIQKAFDRIPPTRMLHLVQLYCAENPTFDDGNSSIFCSPASPVMTSPPLPAP